MLTMVAWISIGIAVASALWIAADEMRHPQAMGIMNVVWPVTALYFSVFAVWGYLRIGRTKTKAAMRKHQGMQHPQHEGPPTAAQVAVSTSHCGAGCALADLVTDFGIAATGIVLFGLTLWTEYTLDFIAAWALGIVFQYLAIKPMGQMSAGEALVAAIKADTLSIAAFQVGMYAWMAVVFFLLFPKPHLTPFDPRYWLMMQVAMVIGYATSFPMNRWLVQKGLKEAM